MPHHGLATTRPLILTAHSEGGTRYAASPPSLTGELTTPRRPHRSVMGPRARFVILILILILIGIVSQVAVTDPGRARVHTRLTRRLPRRLTRRLTRRLSRRLLRGRLSRSRFIERRGPRRQPRALRVKRPHGFVRHDGAARDAREPLGLRVCRENTIDRIGRPRGRQRMLRNSALQPGDQGLSAVRSGCLRSPLRT